MPAFPAGRENGETERALAGAEWADSYPAALKDDAVELEETFRIKPG
jgi:hypothetical protein